MSKDKNDDIPDTVQSQLDRINRNAVTAIETAQELREENQRLRERLAELEEVVDPDPATEYETLSKDQKVRRVRKALLRDALNASGVASMTYSEVRAIFDNNVSPGHAYNLMEQAAHMEGFAYDRAGPQNQGQKRVRVEADSVKDNTLIQSVNKATQSVTG